MARSRNGEAIGPHRKTSPEVRRLRELYWEAKAAGDLETWRRAKAVSGYLAGKRVLALADELDVTRGAINRWLQWYNAEGADGLRPRKAPGGPPRLTEEQRTELASIVEGGPQAAGFTSGVWTGPMIGEWIRRRYGVQYHNHHIPRLLHQLGFSVQRPRRRLCRADAEAQRRWLEERLPLIKKKAASCRGVVLFEDEASFWLDGTLHQTWSRVGVQPRVDTLGQRKTAHVYGAVRLDTAEFHFRFEEVFNGATFLTLLKQLVACFPTQKVFLIIDNGPAHSLEEDGVIWLKANQGRIELHRLPTYSPEFNPMEPIWKVVRKRTTHNRFFNTTDERDTALRRTFREFRERPQLISAHLSRFQ